MRGLASMAAARPAWKRARPLPEARAARGVMSTSAASTLAAARRWAASQQRALAEAGARGQRGDAALGTVRPDAQLELAGQQHVQRARLLALAAESTSPAGTASIRAPAAAR